MPQGKGSVTFLDTPGHAAFSGIRARGAEATDLVVLVVAADDGVMPTTREALALTRGVGVPMVVAITKTDKANANVEAVKQMLVKEKVALEDFGGDVQCVPVSARNKHNLDLLLETLVMAAELADLRADATGNAEGTPIEINHSKVLIYLSHV